MRQFAWGPRMDDISHWIESAAAHHANGELGPAEALYARVLEREPERVEARCGLGVLLSQTGRHAEAVRMFPRDVVMGSGSTLLLIALAGSLIAEGQTEEAVGVLQQALVVDPACPEAHNTLGAALLAQGRILEAVLALRTALKHRPGYAEAFYNMGRALYAGDMPAEAIKAYDAALRARPVYAQALLNKGFAQRDLGELDKAGETFRLAMTVRPAYAEAMHNLGVTLAEQGQVAEGVAWLRRAVKTDPENMLAHSALVYLMEFDPASTPEALATEQAAWNQRHAAGLARAGGVDVFENTRDPHRQLRVGFVSPDFRGHAECRFMLPLLTHLDSTQFEVHCYASVRKPDAVTERYQHVAQVWHDVKELSDAALAERIRGDRIDVLIDLTMHMEGHRLLTFARRPAPVQLSWLAYPGRTGLTTMDYHLTDRHLFPDEEKRTPEGGTTSADERPLYLPDAWFCYERDAELPDVSPPPVPALSSGMVTFGSLNSFRKVSPEVLALWARVLVAAEAAGIASRLVLITPEGSHREGVRGLFAGQGVGADRLELLAPMRYAEYMATYRYIDIALDPFPHAGATTTLDAFCMGVPVLCLRGKTAAGRLGESILTTAGMEEWLAATPEEYVAKAVGYARDLARLANVRAGLREKVAGSALMNAARFGRHFGQAVRGAWQAWCDPAR